MSIEALSLEDQKSFHQVQNNLGQHLRAPDQCNFESDVEDRRLAIYRDLFFNNILSLLTSSYPVMSKILADDWPVLIRQFFHAHGSQTPHFPEVSQEFLTFLSEQAPEVLGRFPFLLELAHYEWVELALSIAKDAPKDYKISPEGDVFKGVPALVEHLAVLVYEYPVHRISPDFLPEQPEYTALLVYRDTDFNVQFVLSNPLVLTFVELAQENPDLSAETILSNLAEQQGKVTEVGVDTLWMQQAQGMLSFLKTQGLLLGTKISPIHT
jgi:hypothetical protein